MMEALKSCNLVTVGRCCVGEESADGRGGLSQRRGTIFRWRESAMRISLVSTLRAQTRKLASDATRVFKPRLHQPHFGNRDEPRLSMPNVRVKSRRELLKLHLRSLLSSSCHLFIMAPDSRRRSSQATPAEISLVHNLKNCFVNLPSSLCSLLINVNTVRSPVPLPEHVAYCCIAGPKCCYRTQLPYSSPFRLKPDEWHANPKVHLCGMDGDAKQEQASSRGQQRWHKWLER